MKRNSLGALIALNVSLLVLLVLVGFGPQTAEAQFGSRSNYLMLSGEAVGRSNQDAVYLMDLTNSRMVGIFFSSSKNDLILIGGRDIGGDLSLDNSKKKR